jgi:hypothetical protein
MGTVLWDVVTILIWLALSVVGDAVLALPFALDIGPSTRLGEVFTAVFALLWLAWWPIGLFVWFVIPSWNHGF